MGLRTFLDNLLASPNPVFDHRVDTTAVLVRGQFDLNRVPDWNTRQANWTGWDWESDKMRDAARKSVTVFACATVIGDAVAEAHLQVETRKQGAWDVAEDRPALQLQALLDRPNPFMEDAEFHSLLVFQSAIMGYAVAEKVRSGAGLPVELWPLRADWLTQRNPESTDYAYTVPGKPPRSIPADDLIWLPWRHDDKMERRGVSPVTVAAREIGIDTNLTDWLKAFLDAGGIPPFVLTTEEVISDDAQVELMQEKWRQKYGGSKAYGSLPILHGGYHVEAIGGDVNAMAWPDLRGMTELKICSAFRVPPGIIGAKDALFSGSLTTTEMDGDMTALQRYAANPMRERMAAGLGRALLPEFGLLAGYRLAFDTSQVRSLQEDTDALHTRVRADWDAGLLLWDEARMAMGLDPLPQKQGQVVKLPFSTMLISPASVSDYDALPAAIVQSQTPSAADTPKPLASGLSDRTYMDTRTLNAKQLEFRAQAQVRIHRDRTRIIEQGSRHIGRFLKEQGVRLSETVAKSSRIEVKDLEAIDWDYEADELAKVLNKFYMANGEAAFEATAGLTGEEAVWQITNPRIAKLMQLLGLRITAINEATRAMVQEIVTNGYAENKPVVDIAKELGVHIEETYANRALTIARTESIAAYGKASVLSYSESGVVDQVEFLDNPDHTDIYDDNCLSCADRDGLVVPLSEAETHIDCEHPNGSLIVLPVLATPLGAD